MASQDSVEQLPLTTDKAIEFLSRTPPSARSITLRLHECTVDLLSFIATRFSDLEELTLYLRDYRQPFGDIVVTADDFATQPTAGASTSKTIAVTIGRIVGAQYAAVLSPLHRLRKLNLGVSLYGPYGSLDDGEDEPEMEDIETSMNVIASEQIAQTLPDLNVITWQNVTPSKKQLESCRRSSDDDDGMVKDEAFRLETLSYVAGRNNKGQLQRIEVVESSPM